MLSKLANLIVWSPLILFALFLVYRHSDTVKATVDHAVSPAKSLVGQAKPNGSVPDAQLDQARNAYTNGDVTAAVNGYKTYIEQNPGNPDAHGELGNIFYAIGNFPEAAQAYYNAANLLIDQNQADRAAELIPLIGQLNAPLANDLSARLAQNNGQPTDAEQAGAQEQATLPPQSDPRYN